MDWEAIAKVALRQLLETDKAVVRPEAEAQLGENGWCSRNVDRSIPEHRGPQPHHLTTAHHALRSAGHLIDETVQLSGRDVTTWMLGFKGTGTATSIKRAAARKRRLYRTFLGWTGDKRLCGDAAEEVVDASLRSLAGSRVWIPPGVEPGAVTELNGRPLSVGGPLDHAGYWAVDPDRPNAGWIPFAVEAKNTRGWVYPWDAEMWDLLAKLADFPDVLPILVARRIHYISFRMFADLGGLGTQAGAQFFVDRGTTRHQIDPVRFDEVTQGLHLSDCVLLKDTNQPSQRLVKFFGETAYTPKPGGEKLAQQALARWNRSAPVVKSFTELRRNDLTPAARSSLWQEFGQAVDDAGLMTQGGWVDVE